MLKLHEVRGKSRKSLTALADQAISFLEFVRSGFLFFRINNDPDLERIEQGAMECLVSIVLMAQFDTMNIDSSSVPIERKEEIVDKVYEFLRQQTDQLY
jgi:uncharacterized protein YuzB (UPF0349 family)